MPQMIPSTDGVRVAVHDLGGAGPPVLFCHATGFHGWVWEPVAAALADRYRCLAVDLRGHGDSEAPDDVDYAWTGMADDVLAVVDACALGPELRAVGWSMGGASLVLAEIARPGLLGRAFLFEPIIVPAEGPMSPPENPLAESARNRREVFPSFEDAIARYETRPPLDAVDPRSLRAYVEHGFRPQPDGSVILKCRGETEARVFEAFLAGAFERLGEVRTPTVVGMSGDGQMPAMAAAFIADALPAGRLEQFQDLSHFAPMEAPERIAESIAAALQ